MDLPDDSQWDETICDLPVCPHPQCWAAVRRIEKGHPRILSSPCKTTLGAEDKLPVLTVVNISDSCFQAKKPALRQSPEFTFTKAHSLLSRSSKLAYKFQGRPHKDSPDKGLITYTKRSPKESHKKLSVLNLNEIQLPCSEDVRHMVVIWIPEEPEKNVWLLPHGEKNIPCAEMKIQLDKMKKSLPLEKNRHDSAISSKMFLTVHRLTLQETKEKAKNDLRIQNTPYEHSVAVAYNPLCGHSTLSGQESGTQQHQQQMNTEGVTLKQVSIERSRKGHFDKSLDFSPDMKNGPPLQGCSASVETVLEASIADQEKILGDLSERVTKISWKPELKLLRILQATDIEEEENQSSRAESENSSDTD
ncbi:hypothetical protein H920_11866 [Fukomys damarensis]|uniref:Uncharacterized protein n=1 Tax=Fukomys damarensis TaxID=885580 RepID=A0A091D8I0_FUKDA|nr:hypothetical protein H920_11866 [Fukomys damarensis]